MEEQGPGPDLCELGVREEVHHGEVGGAHVVDSEEDRLIVPVLLHVALQHRRKRCFFRIS
jgi:hypothetical protein